MRNNLVFKMLCADCGKRLNILRPVEERLKKNEADPYYMGKKENPELPTGGEVLDNSIHIEPCQSCIERYTRPAKDLSRAISTLNALEQKQIT